MDKNEFIKRMEMSLEAAKMLPDDLEPLNVWISGSNEGQHFPQITVYESHQTRPNGFYAFADAVGKMARRIDQGDHDALLFDLDNGVQIYMVMSKEELDDENA
jgi:hypothetical protein